MLLLDYTVILIFIIIHFKSHNFINKQSAVYEEEMDNYRNALKESGADNGLFITKYESMIHTFIAYDPYPVQH